MRRLDLGCGNSKVKGAIGVDICRTDETDAVCNLNNNLPFIESCFDEINLVDVLEHIEDVRKIMEEIYRIGRPGATVCIRVPHFSSTHAYGDFTHRHFFNSESFNYFTKENKYDYYTKASFQKISLKINFWKLHRITGISFLANRFPLLYEKYFPFIFTAMNIEVKLRILK